LVNLTNDTASFQAEHMSVYDELGNLARYPIASGYPADASLAIFKLSALKP
jgi:hypothetical protein